MPSPARLGKDACDRYADGRRRALGCKPEEVFVASTGVIGEPLPDERITAAPAGV